MVGAFRLVYHFPPGWKLTTRGDAFLAASLIPAMATGEDLEVAPEAPVSPRLLEGIARIQDILHIWNPELKKVRIRATLAPDRNSSQQVASFFSGGVDSGYTYLRHAHEITQMVLVHGMDIPLQNEQLFEQVWKHASSAVQSFGKRCVTVRCNVQEFGGAMGVTWALLHGAALASVALLLGCRRIFVPSTSRCDHLHPWGSHLLLDHNWSTEACEIVHDGIEASRVDKLKRIVGLPVLLESLRVCNSGATYNCGRCGKCIRTMTALRLLGASTPTLPPLASLAPLKNLRVNNENEFQYFNENYSLAIERGDRPVAQALRKCIRRYAIRKLAKEFDAIALEGFLRRIYRRVRPPVRGRRIVSTEPDAVAPFGPPPRVVREAIDSEHQQRPGTPLRPSRSAG